MSSQATFLIEQFLEWVSCRPRRIADVREAWQSTCPLNSTWEDALVEELVAFGPGGTLSLTAKGLVRLAAAAPAPPWDN